MRKPGLIKRPLGQYLGCETRLHRGAFLLPSPGAQCATSCNIQAATFQGALSKAPRAPQAN